MELTTGTKVGARRWPYHAAHVDCWEKPWSGEILDEGDPRAWANSIAFPTDYPDPDLVDAHVEWCREHGLLQTAVPVLWEFGRVYWEDVERLRPYAIDLEEWTEAKWSERQVRRAA